MAIQEKNTRLLFGVKVRQLRLDRKLSLHEVSQLTGISVSYLNEIEKGKKKPRADKIAALAEVYNVSYDWLVSLKLSKKLAPIEGLLHSNILNELPLELFGLEPSNLLELLTNAPTKLSAFISTLIEINRSYDMSVEHFYFSVLRSYQEMHENYFQQIEETVETFKHDFKLSDSPLDEQTLINLLIEKYNYTIESESWKQHPPLSKLRSVLIPGTKPKLFLNKKLDQNQRIFALGRELGYQYMKIKNRPYTSTWVEVESFEKVLNNFNASYFASALLIDKKSFIEELEKVFSLKEFQSDAFVGLINKYNVTPETLLHRMTNLLPYHFGINQIFFLRFEHELKGNRFHLTKEMHLSGLHNPHANVLKEHYCRRWISLSIFQEEHEKLKNGLLACKIQKSCYQNSSNEYMVLTIANNKTSISVGLKINKLLEKKIHFINDPNIPQRIVNETCERCCITDCQERVASPTLYKKYEETVNIKKALKSLTEVE